MRQPKRGRKLAYRLLEWLIVAGLVILLMLAMNRSSQAPRSEKTGPVLGVTKAVVPTVEPTLTESAASDEAEHAEEVETAAPPATRSAAIELVREFVIHAEAIRARAQLSLARDDDRGTPARACFASLVRHSDDGLKKLHRLLFNVKKSLPLMAQRYPVIAFVEGSAAGDDAAIVTLHQRLNVIAGFPADHKSGGLHPLMHIFPGGIIFAALGPEDFGTLPNFIRSEANHPWPYPGNSYWGVGYRFMCRFFGVRIMRQTVLEDFDYYMRLDTDSYILARSQSTVVFPVSAGGTRDAQLNAAFRASAGVTATQRAAPLQQWGMEEFVVDRDYFVEAASRATVYSFSMVHPQPTPQFLSGLFEMYDEFVQKQVGVHGGLAGPMLVGVDLRRLEPWDATIHNAATPTTTAHPNDESVRDRANRRAGRPVGSLSAGPDPMGAPRGLGLHMWDNVEIFDLRVFRHIPSHPTPVAAGASALDLFLDTRLRAVWLADSFTRRLPPLSHVSGFGGASPDEVDLARRSFAKYREVHNTRAVALNDFLDHVDHAGGFFYHRWGDAEVRTLTLQLFVRPDEISYLNSLPYQHYHNYHCEQPERSGRPGSQSAASVTDLIRTRNVTSLADVERSSQRRSMLPELMALRDGVLDFISPRRRSIHDDSAAKCRQSAAVDGNGVQMPSSESSAPIAAFAGKRIGGAAMHPAERPDINDYVWKHAHLTATGWLPT